MKNKNNKNMFENYWFNNFLLPSLQLFKNNQKKFLNSLLVNFIMTCSRENVARQLNMHVT